MGHAALELLHVRGEGFVNLGGELALLFNADKLLDFLGKLSTISGSTTLKAVNSLAEQYDGAKVGFELKR